MSLAPLVEDAQEVIAQVNQRLVHWHQALAASVPDEQSDPLSSVWVQAARAKALEALLSGLPGLPE